MKKITIKQKLHHSRRAANELKRRRTHSYRLARHRTKLKNSNHFASSYRRTGELPQVYDIVLSGHLDLLLRTEETLKQLRGFDDLPSLGHQRTAIYVDMADVLSIDAASLLIIKSRLMMYDYLPEVYGARGRLPVAERAQQTMKNAGLIEFFRGKKQKPNTSSAILRLYTGRALKSKPVTPEIPSKIRDFIRTRHQELTKQNWQAVYMAVNECMENVVVHAYSSVYHLPRGVEAARFHVIGLFDEEKCQSTVAILDMGAGIPSTIKRNISQQRLADGKLYTDASLIKAATLGEITESGLSKQGKGLRTLIEWTSELTDSQLQVVSHKGVVKWVNGKCSTKTIPKFLGTLVCLRISSTPATSTPEQGGSL